MPNAPATVILELIVWFVVTVLATLTEPFDAKVIPCPPMVYAEGVAVNCIDCSETPVARFGVVLLLDCRKTADTVRAFGTVPTAAPVLSSDQLVGVFQSPEVVPTQRKFVCARMAAGISITTQAINRLLINDMGTSSVDVRSTRASNAGDNNTF